MLLSSLFRIVFLNTYVFSVYSTQTSDSSNSTTKEPDIQSSQSFTTYQQESIHEESRWRIVGGYDCNVENYSFMVSFIWSETRKHFCGGSLVSLKLVLSAAHCFYEFSAKPELIKAVLGSSHLLRSRIQTMAVKKIHVHEEYDKETNENDIACIHLFKNVVINPADAEILRLPTGTLPDDLSEICDPNSFIIAGWGDVRPHDEANENQTNIEMSSYLQCANVPYITREECMKYVSTYDTNQNIMCTMQNGGKIDACMGDTGGPLFCKRVQYGIISGSAVCAAKGLPIIYTRVDRYLEFIQKDELYKGCGNVEVEKGIYLSLALICFIFLIILK